MKKITELGF